MKRENRGEKTRIKNRLYEMVFSFILGMFVGVSGCASPITVGTVEADPPTVHCLGFSLPIVNGDTNYDAQVSVYYRPQASSQWQEGLPLMRVRPETLGTEDPPENFGLSRPGEQFAGSLFDLDPDTSYDIRLEVQDPDGGNVTKVLTLRTRPVPKNTPTNPRLINVSTLGEFNTALASAQPGDVITLANGTYNGPISINRNGTEDNPLFIRGESRDGVLIDASGAHSGLIVGGAFVTVENMTIQGSAWGAIITDSDHAVLRQLRFTNIFYGINAKGGTTTNSYICDNVLEGKGVIWPDTSEATWNYEGIVMTGSGHVVCHNTLSGFGDALGLNWATDIPNRAIDFYGNDVLWAGDNGLEFDFGERNIRGFRNRFTNAGNHALSFQPVWGGPIYAIRNVIFNTASAPYKLNNDPSGFYILHNTAVRSGWAWTQYGGYAANYQFFNNLTIGTQNAVDMSTHVLLGEINGNGWWPDGQFRFGTSWTSFNDLQHNSPYENTGVLLTTPIFENVVAFSSGHTTFMWPLTDVTLHSNSNGLDAGIVLPNLNNNYQGNGPDMGAHEKGQSLPLYGVRLGETIGPSAPTNLFVK